MSAVCPSLLGGEMGGGTVMGGEMGGGAVLGGVVSGGGYRRLAVKRHHHKHNLRHRYEFKETLGRGTYGKVNRAVDKSGKEVAIKSIRKEKIKDEKDLIHIRREIEIMSSLSHPHIINIYEVFENKDKIVIVMEFASQGDLYDFISDRHRLREGTARHIFRQIVSAVQYCHKNGIVHRDLKLENILLDANGNVKIADFGLSNLYHQDRFLQTFCGSPLYASPEIVNGRPYRGPEVDSWALGVLLYSLVHGSMPFDGQDYRVLVRQISRGEYRPPTSPSDACGLIRWLLMVNPERRASVEDVSAHWWVNWGYKTPVGEGEGEGEMGAEAGVGGECESPSLPGSAWLQRSARSLLESGSRLRCLFRPGMLERQRSLRKSKKENNVSQSLQEGAAGPGEGAGGPQDSPNKSILKRPKSILKKRSNGEHNRGHGTPHPAPHSAPHPATQTPEDYAFFFSHPPAAAASSLPPSAPRKGILKKPPHRESGYYSSPEPSDCSDPLEGEGLGDGDGDRDGGRFRPPPHLHLGVSAPGFPARKGILKRDGKYSTRSSTDSALGSPTLHSFGSVDDLVFLPGPPDPRPQPTGAVSEDSILSSESFDRLELPDSGPQREMERRERRERREVGGRGRVTETGRMRGCVSVDDLLRLDRSELEFRPRLCKIKCFEELGVDAAGSLMDLDNVTEVYQKAVHIYHKLG